jgi:hypothetical protein
LRASGRDVLGLVLLHRGEGTSACHRTRRSVRLYVRHILPPHVHTTPSLHRTWR